VCLPPGIRRRLQRPGQAGRSCVQAKSGEHNAAPLRGTPGAGQHKRQLDGAQHPESHRIYGYFERIFREF
jgi:hypothetical protein